MSKRTAYFGPRPQLATADPRLRQRAVPGLIGKPGPRQGCRRDRIGVNPGPPEPGVWISRTGLPHMLTMAPSGTALVGAGARPTAAPARLLRDPPLPLAAQIERPHPVPFNPPRDLLPLRLTIHRPKCDDPGPRVHPFGLIPSTGSCKPDRQHRWSLSQRAPPVSRTERKPVCIIPSTTSSTSSGRKRATMRKHPAESRPHALELPGLVTLGFSRPYAS